MAPAFCPGTGNLSWVYQKYLSTIAVGFPLKLGSIVLVMLVLKSVVAAASISQLQHIIILAAGKTPQCISTRFLTRCCALLIIGVCVFMCEM